MKHFKKVYEDETYKVIELLSYRGSRRLCGTRTVWCTAYEHTTYWWDHYSRHSLFVILENNNIRHQVHPQSGEFRDIKNHVFDFESEYPPHGRTRKLREWMNKEFNIPLIKKYTSSHWHTNPDDHMGHIE